MYSRLFGTALLLSILGCEQQYVCIASDGKSCGQSVNTNLDFSGTTVDIAANAQDMTEIPLGLNILLRYNLSTPVACVDSGHQSILLDSAHEQNGIKLRCENSEKRCDLIASALTEEQSRLVPKSITLSMGLVFEGDDYLMHFTNNNSKICFSINNQPSCQDINPDDLMINSDANICPPDQRCRKLLKKSLPIDYKSASSISLNFGCYGATNLQNPLLILHY